MRLLRIAVTMAPAEQGIRNVHRGPSELAFTLRRRRGAAPGFLDLRESRAGRGPAPGALEDRA